MATILAQYKNHCGCREIAHQVGYLPCMQADLVVIQYPYNPTKHQLSLAKKKKCLFALDTISAVTYIMIDIFGYAVAAAVPAQIIGFSFEIKS